jgi:hypothetical protein
MGLALFGMHYAGMRLAGLRHPDRQGRRRRFHLRYDPADVSRVAVFENGIWLGDCPAPVCSIGMSSASSTSSSRTTCTHPTASWPD